MSGHSKWHKIRHTKGAVDAKRGRVFTKLIKEITVAARIGGGDLDGNPRLRSAVDAARAANMPSDNIKRAIQKGTGELPGTQIEEVTYEGYGPGGVAIYVQAMTDNKNRTLPEIRHLFGKYGGNLGEQNSVAWMFEKKGYLVVDKGQLTEDELMEIVLEAGGEDLRDDGESYEVLTAPESYHRVREALERRKVPIATVEGQKARSLLNMMEALEDQEDVQHAYANFDIADEEIDRQAS
ncbi:MAG: YebC/PmpR family DNA-binding transcriptional regulator [Acidobacteria bacterium]|nr:MAG: YebC/PmpR family DNA-binding transcriptional regulator [Acidobacteriota bacterium]